jgi:hypothetical protein
MRRPPSNCLGIRETGTRADARPSRGSPNSGRCIRKHLQVGGVDLQLVRVGLGKRRVVFSQQPAR